MQSTGTTLAKIQTCYKKLVLLPDMTFNDSYEEFDMYVTQLFQVFWNEEIIPVVHNKPLHFSRLKITTWYLAATRNNLRWPKCEEQRQSKYTSILLSYRTHVLFKRNFTTLPQDKNIDSHLFAMCTFRRFTHTHHTP